MMLKFIYIREVLYSIRIDLKEIILRRNRDISLSKNLSNDLNDFDNFDIFREI